MMGNIFQVISRNYQQQYEQKMITDSKLNKWTTGKNQQKQPMIEWQQ